MLKLRVITAVVLLAVLLPAMAYPSATPFCVVALVLIAAAGWEWGRLNGCAQAMSIGLALGCVLLCTLAWYAGLLEKSLPQLWTLTGAGWVLAGGWMLRKGTAGWLLVAKPARLLTGVVALCLAWLAMAQARVIGVNFLLSVLVSVWAADIFAYIAGRTLGGRFSKGKLAPAISPGKSWEGVWGGMAGVVVLGFSWVAIEARTGGAAGASLYMRLWQQHGAALMLIALLFLAAMSVVGDLVESLVKRSAGVKDSSGLLPGHGGVLDRIDALLPVLPLALMLVNF